MKRKKSEILLLPVVASLVLLIDQISKHLVTTRLGSIQSWAMLWLASVFRITHVTNTGVAFGLFPRGGSFFIVVAVVVIVAIIVYYRHLPDGQWMMRIALGLQLGGAFGNLVDRLRQGRVVDFIQFNFWPLRNRPVFNLADLSIVTGVVLLAILMLWEEWREQGRQKLVENTADGGECLESR